MRPFFFVLSLMSYACGGASPEMSSPTRRPKAPARPAKPSTSQSDMQLTGLAGEVGVRISTSCNCAKKPTLDVTTTDKQITIQEVLPDGPLARCAEPCVLTTQVTGLTPGQYSVVYVLDGAAETQLSGKVKVR